VPRADNLTTFTCWLSWNLGASISWNPQGLFRPVMGLLYLIAKYCKMIFSCFPLLLRGTVLFWRRRSEHHHILTSCSQTPLLASLHPRKRRFCKERNLSGWSGIVKIDRSVSQITYSSCMKETLSRTGGRCWQWPINVDSYIEEWSRLTLTERFAAFPDVTICNIYMIRFIDLITAEILQPGGRDLHSKTLECAVSTINKKN